MLNILAVIISVALTSLMGAAGVFYLGSAFTTAGPKAAAAGVIQGMAQIDAAWTLYSSDSNTTTTGTIANAIPTITGTATQTDLINTGYLAAVPTAPSVAVTWGSAATQTLAAGYRLDLTNPATVTGLTGGGASTIGVNGGIFVVLASTATNQCLEIARAGGQVAAGVTAFPVALQVNTVATFVTAFNGFRFGCVQVTTATALTIDNSTGVAADNNKFVAYYKY